MVYLLCEIGDSTGGSILYLFIRQASLVGWAQPPLQSIKYRMTSSRTTIIDHIVLFKVRPDATDDAIKRFIDGANSLKVLPGVISISVGSTFAEEWMLDRHDGITHTLSVRLESKDALKVYQDHPFHMKVKTESTLPLLAAPPVAVDYEAVVVLGEG